MRKLLQKWIERLQKRLYNQKDDPRDWEQIRRTIDKFSIMIVNEKPEPNKAVKVYFLHKMTKQLAPNMGKWDGESWRILTLFGYAPVPISLEVFGWEEK